MIKSLFGNSDFWDSCFAANMIHTLDVDTQTAGPDGQDRPKDQALSV
jgi:hypothetical protein